jgi:carbamoyltransferase
LTLSDIDCLAYYEDPIKKLGRQIWMGLPGMEKRGEAILRMDTHRPERDIREVLGYNGPIQFVSHHQAHAASSYFFSGFSEAALMTVDGVGEWTTTSYWRAYDSQMKMFEEVQFPDSLGLLYSTITSYLGFSVNSGEYKVMGLAPYGEPVYANQIRAMVETQKGGQYRLNMKYFDFLKKNRMYSDEVPELFGHSSRQPESEISAFHKNVARSLQVVLEEILTEKVSYLHNEVPVDNLCLAGGVALNCVANGKILKNGPFKHLFVQPAANDAGGAIGAAAIAHVHLTGERPKQNKLEHAYWGPSYSSSEIQTLLDSTPIKYENYCGNVDELNKTICQRLIEGKVIGWFQGRMEFGPRSLGARSILADPRRSDMRDRINALVKKREAFRPFAPAVLEEKVHEHFDLDHPSPFMLEVCQVRSPLELPAITHVDGSARVQTVNSKTNPRFAALINEFDHQTGCPILLNTSFNMRDEPIVCHPVDAIRCFVRSQIDTLVLGDFIIDRTFIPEFWQKHFEVFHSFKESSVSHAVYTFF